jgi:large subunit ribosomal protein L34e
MPRPSLRSRTLRRIRKRIPGGASVIHYLKRNPSPARCARCGAALHGTASKRPSVMKRLAKSKRVPSRIFGGNLCPSCTREALKERARAKTAR